NGYDIVFMDHMMPGMDGVEAVAAIREWEGEQAETSDGPRVPIVALTANAVSGMREMFLAQGFNDFLAKPIDVSKLDEVIGKWLPREKQIKSDGDPASSARKQDSSGKLEIPGVDVKRGIAMTGGTFEGYVEVLELYCQDVAKRLEILSGVPDEDGLAFFTTQVHALKSSSANIGAADLSKEAAMLEDAGKRGDVAAISEALDGFRDDLSLTAERIRYALSLREEGSVDGELLPDRAVLLRLKETLEAEEIRAADGILNELKKKPFGKEIRDLISEVSDCVLMSDFKAAADITEELLAGQYVGHDD
ncbi:MAG: response regulator, partial [Synergistaceae bacterium]|nr:response regulator [Synergistaceae bacterium]